LPFAACGIRCTKIQNPGLAPQNVTKFSANSSTQSASENDAKRYTSDYAKIQYTIPAAEPTIPADRHAD
jgi:hypothetical protein